MFAQQLTNGQGTLSRPFVLCVILILLFLSLQTDMSSSTPSLKRSELRGGLQAASLKDGVKEQILMQLSISQEKLELENKRLKQYVLDLRRAMRAGGCEVNTSMYDAAFVFPELAHLADEHFVSGGHVQESNTTSSSTSGGGGASTSMPAEQPDPLPVHNRNT